MEKQTTPQPVSNGKEVKREDVVISLTLTGTRDRIMDLLDQMDRVPGFSVLDGSFTSTTNNIPPP